MAIIFLTLHFHLENSLIFIYSLLSFFPTNPPFFFLLNIISYFLLYSCSLSIYYTHTHSGSSTTHSLISFYHTLSHNYTIYSLHLLCLFAIAFDLSSTHYPLSLFHTLSESSTTHSHFRFLHILLFFCYLHTLCLPSVYNPRTLLLSLSLSPSLFLSLSLSLRQSLEIGYSYGCTQELFFHSFSSFTFFFLNLLVYVYMHALFFVLFGLIYSFVFFYFFVHFSSFIFYFICSFSFC
ncbi:unnamed protein product [Acanthosepion pharaonis]|uniref:Uncharacterized protein n=1 Tax=Acanthosepion pharaonis TaxID=158019 RepID=A0A812DR65_ACAPH|nr:unnamed protein product [Sepia pharaonis]